MNFLTPLKITANSNSFLKNQAIRVRPGLLYVVQSGVIRIEDEAGVILRLVNSVFEVVEGQRAIAQTDTILNWHYWTDLTPMQKTTILMEMREIEHQEMFWRSIVASKVTVETKVIQLVLYLQDRFGSDFFLTHQEIASILGTTRVTVTRAQPYRL